MSYQPHRPGTTSDPVSTDTPEDPYLASYRLGSTETAAEFGLRDLAARVGDLTAVTKATLDAALRAEEIQKHRLDVQLRQEALLMKIHQQLHQIIAGASLMPRVPRGEGGAGPPSSMGE